MGFTGPVAYDRFMGRYSALLSPQLANLAGVEPGQRALDVGCGPGALTEELVNRLGAELVAAVDPSEPFIGAVGERYPGVDARTSSADDLPFDNDEFDVTLAQLVVHFMPDPVAGLVEMARVTRGGGVVVACVWDHGGGQGPLRSFWKAAREIDPGVDDESHLPGVRQGDLGEIFREGGLQQVKESSLTVSLQHPSFDEWWEPFTLGVGPAGDFAATLDLTARARLRELCRRYLPPAPFVVTGKAWAARGIV